VWCQDSDREFEGEADFASDCIWQLTKSLGLRGAWRVAGQGNVDMLVNIDHLPDGVSRVCF
jgi:hypothetical protein